MCDMPNHGRICTKKQIIEKDLLRQLKAQLGPRGECWEAEKKTRPFESQFWIYTNSTVPSEFDIMTYDQSPEQFEGVELDWAWLNEPSTEAIFKALLGRFKKGGTLFITATILNCSWILDEIIESSNERFKVVTMHINENRISEGGYLPDIAVDDMLNSQDPETREARASGKALKLAGRVFKNYESEKVLIDIPQYAPEGEMIYMATDPHDKLPHYSAWAYYKEGILTIFREHPSDDFWEFGSNPWASEHALAAEYLKIEDREPAMRLLDMRFGNTKKFGHSLTVKQLLYETGLNYMDWDGKNQEAHNGKIRTWLEQDKIKISRNCKNMDKALRRHRYLDPSAKAKEEKGAREDVDGKYRHMIDVLAALVEAADMGLFEKAIIGDFRIMGNEQDIEDLDYWREKAIKEVLGEEVIMPVDEGDGAGYYNLGDLFT